MDFGPWDLLRDFGWMALLLYSGKVIRAKVRLVQRFFVPSSILAGLMGLVLGPQLLDWIPFSSHMQRYPWILVVVLFATFPFSTPKVRSGREVMKKAGSMLCFCLAAEVGAFALALLAGATIFRWIFPEVSEAFPLLMPAGFVGGHGYATAIGGTLERQYDVVGATSIAYTFATVGLFSAILFGIPLINWGIKRRLTRLIATGADIPESLRTGLIPPEERVSIGDQTTSAGSLDPLTFHVVLVLMAALAGHYVSRYTAVLSSEYLGTRFELPDLAAAMLCGLLIKKVVSWIGVGSRYVDRGVATRIGGTVTDWLVAFGVASIQLGVVAEYIWPILTMCAVGWTVALCFLFFLAPRMNPVFWFERGIFAFGWMTGVVAMGIALLRVADPNYRSGTLEAYGLAYTIIAPVELVLVATVPIFIGMGYLWATTGVLLAVLLVPIVLSVVFRFWSNSYPFWEQREGEEEIIAGE